MRVQNSNASCYFTEAGSVALQAFREAVVSARAGQGKLLMLPGPAGCGKSFLLDCFERVAVEELDVPAASIFSDFFKPVAQRPHGGGGGGGAGLGFGRWSDVGETLAQDLNDLASSKLWFKNTIIKIARLAADRYGPDVLQRVRERLLHGQLSGLPDLLHTIAHATRGPAILLLDDFDHASQGSLHLPVIMREIHTLARTGDATFVIVATVGMSANLWTLLHEEAAWSRDWALIKALKPLDPGEVTALCRAACPPDGLPESVVTDITRSTGGIPLLVEQELAVMREIGDTVFTLEAVHAYLGAAGMLPQAWAEVDAFAEWVDDHLVAESGEAAEKAAKDEEGHGWPLPLSDHTYGVESGGTSRYAFTVPAVREYFFGQLAGRRLDAAAVRARLADYATCLSAFAADNPTLIRRVAELYEAADDMERARTWGERVSVGYDLALIDGALASLRSLPSSRPLALRIAELSSNAATLSDQVEPRARTLERWHTARADAVVSDNRQLRMRATFMLARYLCELGRDREAFDIVDGVLAADDLELSFLNLRGNIQLNLGRVQSAHADYARAVTLAEHELGVSGTRFIAAPDAEAGAQLTPTERMALLHWSLAKAGLAMVLDDPLVEMSQPDLLAVRDELEQAIAVAAALQGMDALEVQWMQVRMAKVLQKLHDYERAERLLRHLLDDHERMFGAEHPETLDTRSHLAGTLAMRGEHAAALQMCTAIVESSVRVLGPDHPDTLGRQTMLADILSRLGDLSAARELLVRVIESAVRVVGNDHLVTTVARCHLIEVLHRRGETEAARSELAQVIADSMTRNLGPT
jgi:tetratricopeptide (TPR) repeat protein